MVLKNDLILIAKAFSWQALGLVSMTAIGFVTTGSWRSGGTIAVASAIVSIFTFILHEKLWDKLTVKPSLDD